MDQPARKWLLRTPGAHGRDMRGAQRPSAPGSHLAAAQLLIRPPSPAAPTSWPTAAESVFVVALRAQSWGRWSSLLETEVQNRPMTYPWNMLERDRA